MKRITNIERSALHQTPFHTHAHSFRILSRISRRCEREEHQTFDYRRHYSAPGNRDTKKESISEISDERVPNNTGLSSHNRYTGRTPERGGFATRSGKKIPAYSSVNFASLPFRETAAVARPGRRTDGENSRFRVQCNFESVLCMRSAGVQQRLGQNSTDFMHLGSSGGNEGKRRKRKVTEKRSPRSVQLYISGRFVRK